MVRQGCACVPGPLSLPLVATWEVYASAHNASVQSSASPMGPTQAGVMSFASVALLSVVVALVIYLLASLIFPERF